MTEGAAAPAVEHAATFARHSREVPYARHFIRMVLGGHPASADAELLACELITNAVLHAGDAAKVTVTVTVSGPLVHIDVADDGIAGVPHWRDTDPDADGGRGFRLVNELAERWGFLREKARARSSCWFELGAGEPA
jgi:anti-sigma regulatory factor (Ser/Thr protein kinase)